MSGRPDDPGEDAAPTPARPRSQGGGCLIVTGLLLLLILAALIGTAWLYGRHDTPNPALSGRPPQLPAR